MSARSSVGSPKPAWAGSPRPPAQGAQEVAHAARDLAGQRGRGHRPGRRHARVVAANRRRVHRRGLRTVIFPPRALEHGAGLRDPEATAGGVLPLGDAGADSGEQRHAWGSAGDLPPTWRCGSSGWGSRSSGTRRGGPGQRRGGAEPGHGEAVVRAAALRQPGRVAAADRRLDRIQRQEYPASRIKPAWKRSPACAIRAGPTGWRTRRYRGAGRRR